MSFVVVRLMLNVMDLVKWQHLKLRNAFRHVLSVASCQYRLEISFQHHHNQLMTNTITTTQRQWLQTLRIAMFGGWISWIISISIGLICVIKPLIMMSTFVNWTMFDENYGDGEVLVVVVHIINAFSMFSGCKCPCDRMRWFTKKLKFSVYCILMLTLYIVVEFLKLQKLY